MPNVGQILKDSWLKSVFLRYQEQAVNLQYDPDGDIENSGKSIFEIRIPNFCYIQVIVSDLSYLPVAAVGT